MTLTSAIILAATSLLVAISVTVLYVARTSKSKTLIIFLFSTNAIAIIPIAVGFLTYDHSHNFGLTLFAGFLSFIISLVILVYFIVWFVEKYYADEK